MRKTRTGFVCSTILAGRRFKEDAPGGGGGTPPAGGDNPAPGTGNSEPGASGSGDSNNTGPTFDPSAFWSGSEADQGSAPPGESVSTPTPSPAPAPSSEGGFAATLTQRLEGLTFDPIFDGSVAEEINAGNFEGINKKIAAQMQQAVRESLGIQVQILKPAFERLLEQVRNEQQQTFNSRDNNESLVTLFPAAKNPVMAKTIQPIYAQALKNTKGDRESAVKQTKEMLRFMAGEAAGDLNLQVAPRGEGDYRPPSSSNLNWLDELTSREG